eukprot:Phypoly_transcript_05518.p1 GENE.Phypoly_transcript_05518~~Phypoly_transcript_05518.p1  ORF type:complete len:366 (+),score=64.40 Phypoly_transcript_05518:831-1928(+)
MAYIRNCAELMHELAIRKRRENEALQLSKLGSAIAEGITSASSEHSPPAAEPILASYYDRDVQVKTILRNGGDVNIPTPQAIAVDKNNKMYISDASDNKRIMCFSPEGAPIVWAQECAKDLEMGPDGELYAVIVSASKNAVCKIPSQGSVIDFVGGTAAEGKGPAATLSSPNKIKFDKNKNLYLADNCTIKKITPEGEVSILAGSPEGTSLDQPKDGKGTEARFTNPNGIALDSHGNIFVVDSWANQIRKITPEGEVTTYAGSEFGLVDGPRETARFLQPADILIDSNDVMYIAELTRIRCISPDGQVTTVAGGGTGDEYTDMGDKDGNGKEARFKGLVEMCFDTNGDLLACDCMNKKIVKITIK